MKAFFCIMVVFVFLLLSLHAPAQQQPLTFESLYDFATPGDLALSADGRYLVYAVRRSDVASNSNSTEVWIMAANGKKNRLIRAGAHAPCWVGGGGKFVFLADDGGVDQLYSYDLTSGKIDKLTAIPQGISAYVWSPSGQGILLTRSVYPEDSSPEYFAVQQAAKKEKKHGGLIYDKLLFRPYNHLDDGTVKHVFYYQFASGRLTDLSPGPYHAPTSHLGGNQDLAFSPDGRSVAYTTNTDPVKAVSTNNDIFLVNIDGSGRRRLTENLGCDVYPVFSPDGRTLAYTEMAKPGYEADQKKLILFDLGNGSRSNLTRDLDLGVDEIIWSRRGAAVFFTCKEKGFDALYKIDLKTGRSTCLVNKRIFSNLALSRDEKSFYCITSSTNRPAEIARFDLIEKRFTTLTHLADDFVKDHVLPGRSEVFWYKGAYGDDVQGFLTRPVPFDPGKKYPLVMLLHGGPEGDWNGGWSNYGGNVNLFAAQGYVVAKPNIHGATSFGAKFKEAILNHWGRVDQEDIMKCLDYLVARYPFIDGSKIGASGRSYGGYLVNWLNGQTDRFACFVSVDGIFDQLMSYYSTDELWFPEMEFGGTPMSNREEYMRSSPSTYAQNFKTPTLVLHGGKDYRVDLSQGIAMYTALQRLGVPARFILFPDEGHYYRKLQNWKFATQQQFAWLARFLKN
ncbi:MAG TPA: S9 family peptidase [Patescibacteria group bacterium]|nr:S9 family peptidase [Patescibacteria group bacterium]